MHSKRVSTLKRHGVNDCVVSVMHWVLTHTVQPFHRKNVKSSAHSKSLGHLERLLASRVDEVLKRDSLATLSDYLVFSLLPLFELLSKLNLKVGVFIFYFF